MKRNKFLRTGLFLLVSGMIFLSACRSENMPPVTSTAIRRTTSPTQTAVPAATQTFASVFTNTATETPLPTKTPAPLPTLPPDEAMTLIVELLRTNAGCELPCYWGFTPGVTSWSEARQFLKSIVDYYSTRSVSKNTIIGEISFPVPKEIDPNLYLPQAYTVRDGIIDQIEVETGIVPTYTLSSFLTIYGPPDEIWINPDAELILSTYLFYPRRGILAIYTHHNLSLTDTDVVVCPQNESNPLLVLWSPALEKSFLDDVLNHTALLTRVIEKSLYHQIDEVTDMDIDTFYETYTNPETDICFRVPREKWPDMRIIP